MHSKIDTVDARAKQKGRGYVMREQAEEELFRIPGRSLVPKIPCRQWDRGVRLTHFPRATREPE
jgi:hypothetical protein